MTLHLLSTDDIPQRDVEKLLDALRRTVDVVPRETRLSLRSLEAPSWIRLIGESDWWVQLFAGVAALYVAELVKEAAKETWKVRARLVAGVGELGSRFRALALSLFEFKNDAAEQLEVVVGLPEPNEYFGVQLQINGSDPLEVEFELALFVHYLPAVKALLKSNAERGTHAATGYFLQIEQDGDLAVSWFDANTLERREALISLRGNPV